MSDKPKLSTKKKLLFSFFILFIALITLEVGSRLIDRAQGNQLDVYKRFSDNPKLGYELVPNYKRINEKKNREALVINSLGYRGPEFNLEKAPNTTRILCIGDSCTFEGIPETAPYPRQLEELLNQGKEQKAFEVINGGVEGYDSNKALERLKLSLKYKPDIVTIYIGWNDLYINDPERIMNEARTGIIAKISNMLQYSRFASKLRSLIFLKLRPKFKTTEPINSSKYQDFVPSWYVNNVKEMISLVKSSNAKPILVTLPSIFHNKISPDALARAQMPHFTNSSADMILLTEKYNKIIKEIAQETNTPLIDLAAKFDQLPNKEELFFDAIHMYNPGKPLVAEEFKTEVEKLLPAENTESNNLEKAKLDK